MSDSIWSWDSRQFGGWVPHQNVGYLWPTGPFYAIAQALGSPDWLAQRLWIGLLLVLAGTGALKLARNLGLPVGAATLAALAYQLSPYTLPYISRTSALLLPWSLLPWIIVVSMRYARDHRVPDLALFVLLIASSGGLNITALLMIAPAPVIWIVYLVGMRVIPGRDAVKRLSILACAAVLASLWWLAGLFVQGRYGAAVLSYSEALISTSATSSAAEVLRGLGYWLFYDRNSITSLTTASTPYQESILLLSVGSLLVILGLYGISRSDRWKRPLGTMLLTGIVLAVGAFPFRHANLLMSPLADNPKSSLSLALRSSTRAAPMVVLALALGIGIAYQRVTEARWLRASSLKTATLFGCLCLLIVGNLPAAINGDLMDRSLLRPETLPQSWYDAAAYLDQRFDSGFTGAVLLLPGIESAAYRWGYTVDPILPGLTKKPLITRDWLPLGNPQMMDLLYALDDSFQSGTADPDSIAVAARLLGADTIMVVGSHQYERFGTISPARAFSYFDPTPAGLIPLVEFGIPTENVDTANVWTEEQAVYPPTPEPEISLFAVSQFESSFAQYQTAQLAATDGTGLVDLAAANLITGDELLFSEASLDDQQAAETLRNSPWYTITDSNRRRAHHWRSSQEVWGATESDTAITTVFDDFDSRLPIYPNQGDTSQTSIESSRVNARATSYGAGLRYEPEYRPHNAIDGNTRTAWRIAPDRSAVGHILTVTSENMLSELRFLQPLDPGSRQWITRVSIRTDSAAWTPLDLSDSSRRQPGQLFSLPIPARIVDIRIDSLNSNELYATSLGVGFSEVLALDEPRPEVVVLPHRLPTVESKATRILLTRLRSDPFDRWRDDPEGNMFRRVRIGDVDIHSVQVEARLNPRAADDVLAKALSITGPESNSRLSGSARWWGLAAFDGDPSTSWMSAVSTDTRAQPEQILSIPLSNRIEWIELVQTPIENTSRISELELQFVREGSIVSTQLITVPADEQQYRFDVQPIEADHLLVRIVASDRYSILDAFTHRAMSAPVSISELSSNAWTNKLLPDTFDTGCRQDLLEIDNRRIALRLSGNVTDALNGAPVSVSVCDFQSLLLKDGSLIRTSPGIDTGWDLDRVSLATSPSIDASDSFLNLPWTQSRDSRSTTVKPCQLSCWVKTNTGYSPGWKGLLTEGSIRGPIPDAAGRTVYRIDSHPSERVLHMKWTPQIWLWLGFALTATTIAAALVVLLVHLRRRRTFSDISVDGSTASIPRHWSQFVLVAFLLGCLLVDIRWGLVMACSVAVSRIARNLFLPALISAMTIGFAYIVTRHIRIDARAGFDWPILFERAHRPMMAVLTVFVIALHLPNEPGPRFSIRRNDTSEIE